MKVSRRQVVLSGGAYVVMPLTGCVAQHPASGLPSANPQSAKAAPREADMATPKAVPTPPSAAPPSTSHAESDGAASEPGAPAASCEQLVAKIGRNHGHDFPITARDVLDGASKRFDLRGKSDHTHEIELTAEELAALGRGEVVRKQSERGGPNAHRHRVMLKCEPLVLPPEMISACEIVVAGKDDHELVIPESHVREGIERSYDIQGVAGHTHTLLVKPADFQRIAAGENVDLTSGPGLGHFHHVYIRYGLPA